MLARPSKKNEAKKQEEQEKLFNVHKVFKKENVNQNTKKADANGDKNNNKKSDNTPNKQDALYLSVNKRYQELLNKTKEMSEKLEFSKPFSQILQKVLTYFPDHKSKEAAEAEAERIRLLPTEKAADFFVNLKLNTTQDYWYYYYLLAKVALKGRKNSSNQLAEEWDLPEEKGYDSDFADDEFYLELKSKDNFYSKILSNCTKKTLADIRNQIFKSNFSSLKMDFVYKDIANTSKLQFSDYAIQEYFIKFIQATDFFKEVSRNMPKGIIHHLHLGACFNDFYSALSNVANKDLMQEKVLNGEFVMTHLYEEDKIRKGEFNTYPYPKIFYIEDIMKVIYSSTPEMESLFKQNFILPNGNCIPTIDKNKNLPLDSNFKAYYYWLFCNPHFIYSNRTQELVRVAEQKGLLSNIHNSTQIAKTRIFKMHMFISFLNGGGKIFENRGYSPELQKSSKLFSYSIEDYFSNSIWQEFESIFGMYSNLFENPVLMGELIKLLAKTFEEQKIYGAEFRQKYDGNKGEYSKYKKIKSEFALKNILTSFIIPGRKVKNGNGLKSNIEELNKNKEEDVSGFDFVGYEDDAFTGARNFFSNTILKSKDSNINNLSDINSSNQSENEFELLFNALKNGKLFYPHTGETIYLPDYPIDEKFMDKFYINDNLIHAALLHNVERIGHGFAVINNGLIASILKQKRIGLEICPVSNQLLLYHKVRENPGLKLLRRGLKVAISPDDPGFFGYMGVSMDWFFILMQTDVKASEIYMMLKNSILKASPNIYQKKDALVLRLQKDLEAFLSNLKCEFSEEHEKILQLNENEVSHREAMVIREKVRINTDISTSAVLRKIQEKHVLLNIYSKKAILEQLKK